MGRAFVRRERSSHTMSALVCGLDVHKDSTYATILDANGKIVNQKRMGNDRVLPYLSDYRIDRIGMESSNQVAPLYRVLTKKGYAVSVSHPKKTRYIAEAKIKSDRVDSKAIAELVRLNALPLAYMPDEETAILREKIRKSLPGERTSKTTRQDQKHTHLPRNQNINRTRPIHTERRRWLHSPWNLQNHTYESSNP